MNNSEFDKFESFLTRANEDLYLQNKVNAASVMHDIELMYGPFKQDDIEFYKRRYAGDDGMVIINSFQKELVFNLFYKYFGDTVSVDAINLDDYIKLIMAGKRILESCELKILPYILSGKVVRLATRKNVNKKELTKIELSDSYQRAKEKYDDEKIDKLILSIIAQLLSSDFEFVDPDDEDGLNGTLINIVPELVSEEVLIYISII